MLGSSLVPALISAGHGVVATDIDLTTRGRGARADRGSDHLDVRDRDEVRRRDSRAVRPDIVLHLAAETSLEVSDADPDHAYLTNTIATKYVALQARSAGIPMVYISTAGVFDGQKDGAPTPSSTGPNPINTYGASKYEGELLVARRVLDSTTSSGPAGWSAAGAAKDHKFVSRIVDQVRDGAAHHLRRHRQARHADLHPRLLPLPPGAARLGGLRHSTTWPAGERAAATTSPPASARGAGPHDIELVAVGSEHFAEEFPSAAPAVGDHAQHGARPAGDEHDAPVAGRARRVPP